MKINNSKVISYDPLSGNVQCENGTGWYLGQSLAIEFEQEASVNITELAKLGYSADDIVKLKHQGVI